MKIETLKTQTLDKFISYCKKHRHEVDDSFLYDQDLEVFKITPENPTYILIDESEELVGAASLIIDDYYRNSKTARFRIFHSEVKNLEYYYLLFNALIKHTCGLDKIIIFISMENKKIIDIIRKLNFKIERYSMLLLRQDSDTSPYEFPEGYELKPFIKNRDEQNWCIIRNEAFKNLLGSEKAITPEIVSKMLVKNDFIDGGMMILYHKDRAIGIVKGSQDEYDNSPVMNIGPLALLPEYQNKGLGKNLLRASIQFAKENSYTSTVLCVNGDNERAKYLYLKEGFKEVESLVCYEYILN